MMSSSKWTFCVCLLTCLLNWTVSEVKTVQSGEDVCLLCQGPRGADIVLVEWIRPDLVSEGFVLLFRDDRIYENYQHPSFHGRVELRDPQMKDGDTSVILKNVTINDRGTYKCYVRIKGNSPQLINSVHLKVKHSDQQQITVKTGDDVTLQCLDHRGGDIELLEWRRQDLEEDVFVCIYGNMCENQHPTFKNRVELRDPEMKDGDVSVILKKVKISDTGTYECYVKQSESKRWKRTVNLKDAELIFTITLNFTDSGAGGDKYGHVGLILGLIVDHKCLCCCCDSYKPYDCSSGEAGDSEDGGDKHGHVGLVVTLSVVIVLVVFLVAVGFTMYRKSKRLKMQIYQPPADEAADPEL
ncbi:junctional adhesion molecule-like isoform X2 [Channa argus]|uniref:junctional adhesion molecule-like isoform X2 n=1 Tax=Channa argus TaxID=215402 RepID=UPI003520B88C